MKKSIVCLDHTFFLMHVICMQAYDVMHDMARSHKITSSKRNGIPLKLAEIAKKRAKLQSSGYAAWKERFITLTNCEVPISVKTTLQKTANALYAVNEALLQYFSSSWPLNREMWTPNMSWLCSFESHACVVLMYYYDLSRLFSPHKLLWPVMLV